MPDDSIRFVLWVEAAGWDDATMDAFCTDVLGVAVGYGKTAHIEAPLTLVDPA
jgi:hypothetical protein